MTVRWSVLLLGTCFLLPAAPALAAVSPDVVRDLASRVGPVIGQAATCPAIAQGRVQTIIDQFGEVIRLTVDLRGRIASAQVNCQTAERQLSELERSLSQQPSAAPTMSLTLAPSSA